MPAVEKTLAIDIGTHPEFDPVTPSNTAELAGYTRRIFVGGAGNLNVERMDGTMAFIQGIPAGTILPIRVRKVRVDDGATPTPGNVTTATNILALY